MWTAAPPLAPAFARWALLDQIRTGRLPLGWRTVLDADPLLRRVVLVVDLVLGDRAVRVSTVAVRSVSSRTGERHDALPLLVDEPGITSELRTGFATSAARQIDVSLDALPFRPSEIPTRGGVLCGVAELSLELAGAENDYDQRLVLLRGDVVSAAFGAVRHRAGKADDREVLVVQITDPRDTVGARLPPWVLGTDRHPALPDASQGATYPIVLTATSKLPAVRITDTATGSNSFAVAAGAVEVESGAGNVFINGRSVVGGVNAWTAEQAVDSRGTPYTRVRFTNAAKVWADSDAVHVTCSAAEADARPTPIEVIRAVVERYSPIGIQGANASLFSAAAGRFPTLPAPRVAINASGGQAATVLDWIENGFCASYPMISMLWDRGGYGPVVVDSRSPPVAALVVGTGYVLGRASLASETPKNELVNEVVVRYGYSAMLDSWAGVVVRSAENSGLCAASEAEAGRRAAEPLDALYIADAGTAAYVADWIVQHRALPAYVVELDVLPAFAVRFAVGDAVSISDEAMGWSAVPATIERIAYGRARCTATLRVWLRGLAVGWGAVAAGGA